MGVKTLAELAADANAKAADYDPANVQAMQNLCADVKNLILQAIAKKLTKEPDVEKMKGVVVQMTETIQKRQTSWDTRYHDAQSLATELKGRPMTAQDKQFLQALETKVNSSKAKYDTLYDAVAELSKELKNAPASLSKIQKMINAGVLLTLVNHLRARITEVGHVLLSIGH